MMATVLKDGSLLISEEGYYELMDTKHIYDALWSVGVDIWSGCREHWEYYGSSFDPDYCDED